MPADHVAKIQSIPLDELGSRALERENIPEGNRHPELRKEMSLEEFNAKGGYVEEGEPEWRGEAYVDKQPQRMGLWSRRTRGLKRFDSAVWDRSKKFGGATKRGVVNTGAASRN